MTPEPWPVEFRDMGFVWVGYIERYGEWWGLRPSQHTRYKGRWETVIRFSGGSFSQRDHMDLEEGLNMRDTYGVVDVY